MVCNDCPAVLLPNGKVLFTAANFVAKNWGSPIFFFEYDPVANTIVSAPTPPNNNSYPYTQDPGIYWSRLMLLPTGQVLFSAGALPARQRPAEVPERQDRQMVDARRRPRMARMES